MTVSLWDRHLVGFLVGESVTLADEQSGLKNPHLANVPFGDTPSQIGLFVFQKPFSTKTCSL